MLGSSLPELLLTVSVLGAIGGLSFHGLSTLTEQAEEGKLDRDVDALNAAVRVYMAEGGTFSAETSAGQVIERLKRKMSAELAERQVGVTGSMLDPRLTGVTATAGEIPAGDPRAVWDAGARRFVVTTAEVGGITHFELSDEALNVEREADDSRRSAMLFASTDGWVWDYQDVSRSGLGGPSGIGSVGMLGGGGALAPMSPTALKLHPPLFSLEGGIYAEEDFDLQLHFSDPNPVGVSEVWYSVDGAPFERYIGDPVMITGESEVQAITHSLDPDAWVDSDAQVEGYRQDILYFSGNTSGRFMNPTGDPDMVVSIENSDTAAEMWWGAPYTRGGWFEGNYLRFEGTEFTDVRAFEEFTIGDLTYFNSTTYMGTNATGVDLEVMLEILVPNVTAAFTYGFELLSTRNSRYNTADENADFVWIGDPDGSFTAEIRGYDYTLELRFAELAEDADGFTTPDTFHVHEGSWATGAVYGTLIRGERSEGNTGDPVPIGPLPEDPPADPAP